MRKIFACMDLCKSALILKRHRWDLRGGTKRHSRYTRQHAGAVGGIYTYTGRASSPLPSDQLGCLHYPLLVTISSDNQHSSRSAPLKTMDPNLGQDKLSTNLSSGILTLDNSNYLANASTNLYLTGPRCSGMFPTCADDAMISVDVTIPPGLEHSSVSNALVFYNDPQSTRLTQPDLLTTWNNLDKTQPDLDLTQTEPLSSIDLGVSQSDLDLYDLGLTQTDLAAFDDLADTLDLDSGDSSFFEYPDEGLEALKMEDLLVSKRKEPRRAEWPAMESCSPFHTPRKSKRRAANNKMALQPATQHYPDTPHHVSHLHDRPSAVSPTGVSHDPILSTQHQFTAYPLSTEQHSTPNTHSQPYPLLEELGMASDAHLRLDQPLKELGVASDNVSSTQCNPTAKPRRRRPRVSYSTLTEEERYQRIRDLNNEASKLYRERHRNHLSQMEEEEQVLHKRNTALRAKVANLQQLRDNMMQFSQNFLRQHLGQS
ncbi:uncharacterized protein [Panulirus ornatus]|uniref:uncharacterized protein n=1 Tax=Panulirus ornatus TaxID=150431 RepID=UPI003A8A6EDD